MEVIGMETHWLNPSLGFYLRKGKLSKTMKLNRNYSIEEARMIISKCPDISEIGPYFKVPNEELMKELMQRFGHKIKVVDCFLDIDEVGVVFENCPHLKSLRLRLCREMKLDEKSIHYPQFKQLKRITLFDMSGGGGRESCTTTEIIGNCAESIEDLSLVTSPSISNGVFEVLADCKKLHTFSLRLSISSRAEVTKLYIKNKHHKPFQAQLLKSFEVYLRNEENENWFDDITSNIIRYGQKLARLEFSGLKPFPSRNIKQCKRL
eukprot:Seg1521.4 transcript_id=Seg1521.4/GoldUCD/mRNA.D3Y31 product="hypothetical protein" protein_id=Seg1521.4/GoldUCD/D3Y31